MEDIKIKIIEYKYEDNTDWNFSQIQLKNINLFVGITGSGKTRLLNTIFNIASHIMQDNKAMAITHGYWQIKFSHDEKTYAWEYKIENVEKKGSIVVLEKLSELSTNGDILLIDRTSESFNFKKKSIPMLSRTSCGIYLLREEDSIKPIYNGWGNIIRRNFFTDELIKACGYYLPIPENVYHELQKSNLLQLTPEENVNFRLWFLKEKNPKKFQEIINLYKSIFPTIEDCNIVKKTILQQNVSFGGQIPIFAIKETGVNNSIDAPELSSGMQKVLLLLTDIVTLPPGSIYLIDEYENSLGINAINFLPSLLLDYPDKQFVMTSHHPYIINNFPISNWYVFHRKASTVTIKHGAELEKKFSKSHQAAFTQLINDSFYTEGLE